MRRLLSLLLFLLLIGDVVATNCTAGYTDKGNGVCQSAKHDPSPQHKAYASCASDNAYMSTVGNAFENANVASLAGGSSAMWLGLTCASSEKTSCLWDNGISITNSSYSNFYSGQPNAAVGACVAMDPMWGMWYSINCTSFLAAYVCQTSPGVYVPQCPSPSYYFRGHCYYPLNAIGYGTVASTCSANCGNIASIHNDGENSYVRDIAVSNSTKNLYTYIGLTYSNGSYQWDDGTQMNFDKFGFTDLGLGTCVFMATADGDVVRREQWMSGDCSEDTVAVCKTGDRRFVIFKILSPGYPVGGEPGHCQYIITQDPGMLVTFTIQELALDRNSTIKAYNSPADTAPFVTIDSSSTTNGIVYFAASNFLKITYDTTTDNTANSLRYHWRLKYGGHSTGDNHCGGLFNTTPSTISGPHFPQNCVYLLRMGAATGRTCIKFSSANVQPGDSIAIYDGPVSSQNQIGFLASKVANIFVVSLALCTTVANYVTVVTSASSGLSYEMFVLTAADSPAVLNPVATGYYISEGSEGLVVPRTDSHYLSNNYGRWYTLYSSGSPNKAITANLTFLQMPDPHFIIVLNGYPTNATVALAYGSLSASRMAYQSSQQYLTMTYTFNQGGPTIAGWSAYFSAVP